MSTLCSAWKGPRSNGTMTEVSLMPRNKMRISCWRERERKWEREERERERGGGEREEREREERERERERQRQRESRGGVLRM